ncbi:MAG: hypothetical protein LM590_01670 [Thermofilum sp.]|nr:hypothetical protein [Thermofilum sp.]
MLRLDEQVEKLRGSFSKAEEMWSDYYSFVKATVREWEFFKLDLLDELNDVKVKLEADLKSVEELNLKIELGLINEEKAKKKLEELQGEISQLRAALQKLWLNYEELTLKCLTHSSRVGLPISFSLRDLEEKRAELRKATDKGMLNEDTAQSLAKILEEQEALLMRATTKEQNLSQV